MVPVLVRAQYDDDEDPIFEVEEVSISGDPDTFIGSDDITIDTINIAREVDNFDNAVVQEEWTLDI